MRIIVEGAGGFRASWDPARQVWVGETSEADEMLLMLPRSQAIIAPIITPFLDYSEGSDLVNRLADAGISAKIVEPSEPPPVEWEPDVIY